MTALMRMERVSRTFGSGSLAVLALDDVSLTIGPGELVVVMRPSGCGKTTLLRVAGGLDRPTSGHVWLGSELTNDAPSATLARQRRRYLGFVYQDFNLVSSLTSAENVALPLELDGVRVREARAAAHAQLETLGLEGLGDRLPSELSGGQQQRVAIARATVGTRRLILADEPTGALDQETGQSVLRMLRARCDAGAAAVVATHDVLAQEVADRCIALRDGRATSVARAGHRLRLDEPRS